MRKRRPEGGRREGSGRYVKQRSKNFLGRVDHRSASFHLLTRLLQVDEVIDEIHGTIGLDRS